MDLVVDLLGHQEFGYGFSLWIQWDIRSWSVDLVGGFSWTLGVRVWMQFVDVVAVQELHPPICPQFVRPRQGPMGQYLESSYIGVAIIVSGQLYNMDMSVKC